MKDPIGFELYDTEGTLLYSDLHGNPVRWTPTAA